VQEFERAHRLDASTVPQTYASITKIIGEMSESKAADLIYLIDRAPNALNTIAPFTVRGDSTSYKSELLYKMAEKLNEPPSLREAEEIFKAISADCRQQDFQKLLKRKFPRHQYGL
jgi:hypothetical protein